MKSIQKEREDLIESFGVYFESFYHMSPLGSRILGLLIVDGIKEGLTFEQLVEKTGASKSSVSTNLNLLLKMEKINYFTIPGDRKKYYKSSPFSERLNSYLKIIAYERKIIDKMLSYREKTMSSPEELINLDNTRAYKAHVIKVEELIKETISEFTEIENPSNPHK
ncbi:MULTISPECIES: GbsR/MarR family transcriptional regulator [unclassified Flavobacterium]|uniref:GbsR/MarR family transcriptional regulator n=1 Tax=unclassified Flavobacterium TaxID=196869 RepID=UPI00064AF6FF|nr:hypothetical protein [Flavobacterium sp. ABG]KLT70402.1 hypothetical protein AB674_06945 [Flavobacterium sp. ABG]